MKAILQRKSKSVLLDTHVIVHLNQNDRKKFGPKATETVSDSYLLIPQISILELDYLREIGRVTKSGKDFAANLMFSINASLEMSPLIGLVEFSQKIQWTRNPFDRLIVAASMHMQVPLLTSDENILSNYKYAVDQRL
jgi:PIN domain nuclease of toxin-antitoxin system